MGRQGGAGGVPSRWAAGTNHAVLPALTHKQSPLLEILALGLDCVAGVSPLPPSTTPVTLLFAMWVRSCWLRACKGDAGLTAPGSCPSPLHIPTQWERTHMFQLLFPAPVARFCRAALTVRLYRPTSNPAPCQSPAAAAPGSEPLKRSVSRGKVSRPRRGSGAVSGCSRRSQRMSPS